MSTNNEFLDFCRVKKIFDKGFGFLSSIYFEEDVFFHFSKIKNTLIKEKLQELKRGVVYLFYTSSSKGGKRKVEKIWLDIKDVDSRLIPPFMLKIIDSFNGGRTNIYELAYVVKLLREAEYLTKELFQKLLNTSSVRKIPSVILAMLNDKELKENDELKAIVELHSDSGGDHSEMVELVTTKLYK